MNPAAQSELQPVLHGRCEAIAERWYQAIAPTSSVSLRATKVRQQLVELTEQITDLLLAEPFQRGRAQAIGAALARLYYLEPEALGRTQEVLARQFVEGLPGDQVVALQPHLSTLLGELAAGFVQQARDTILDEQEMMHRAFVGVLRRTEQTLRIKDAAMESAMNAIALCDLERKVTYGNRAFLTMWGYDDLQEVLGRDAVDFWRSGDQALAVIEALKETGGWSGKLVARRKDGSTFNALISISVVEDDAGQPIQMMGSFVDITHRERMQEMLEQHAERLQVLHEIDQAILLARSPEEIAKAALRHMQQFLPCQRASVVLFEFEAGEFTVLTVQPGGGTTVETEGIRLPLEGLEEQIETLRQGKACLIDDVQSLSTLPAAIQVLQANGLRSYLAVPLRPQEELIGSLVLWAEHVGALGPEHLPIAREVADSLAIAIQHAQLFESVRQQRERLRTLTARLAEAEEAERQRLARILHDQIGQSLATLGLNLSLVRTQVGQDASHLVLSRLDDSLALVAKMTERTRRVMADLRPPTLDDYGLVTTLRWYGEQFASRTGASVTVQGEEPVPRLAAQVESALCRIVQEALTNITKHARASQAMITVTADDQIVRLVIADDGVGFDRAQLTAPDDSHDWGLLTMTERAEAVGARCRVESHLEQGTRVIVEVAR